MSGVQVPTMSFDGPLREEMHLGFSTGRPRLPDVSVPFTDRGVAVVSGHTSHLPNRQRYIVQHWPELAGRPVHVMHLPPGRSHLYGDYVPVTLS